MPVESMVCPNCGATIEFPAGATSTQCKYCNTTLRLKAEAVAAPDGAGVGSGATTLAGNAGPYAVDLDRIQQLARNGKKIEAIKLLREQTHLGLKEAKDAVEALERGELPTITIDQHRAASSPASPVRRFGCLVGCLPILAIIVACAGLIMLAGNLAFRAWGPYDQALAMARADAKVIDAFGASFTPGAFVMGSISSSGRNSSAQFEVPIYGAQRSGMMYVSGTWRRGVWDVSVTINYDEDGEEQSIYLSDTRK